MNATSCVRAARACTCSARARALASLPGLWPVQGWALAAPASLATFSWTQLTGGWAWGGWGGVRIGSSASGGSPYVCQSQDPAGVGAGWNHTPVAHG